MKTTTTTKTSPAGMTPQAVRMFSTLSLQQQAAIVNMIRTMAAADGHRKFRLGHIMTPSQRSTWVRWLKAERASRRRQVVGR